jgi:hypothetical protein
MISWSALRFGESESLAKLMAYDECVAERLRGLFLGRPGLTEKKMFGGLAFMYRGHMRVGIIGESLMTRSGSRI